MRKYTYCSATLHNMLAAGSALTSNLLSPADRRDEDIAVVLAALRVYECPLHAGRLRQRVGARRDRRDAVADHPENREARRYILRGMIHEEQTRRDAGSIGGQLNAEILP